MMIVVALVATVVAVGFGFGRLSARYRREGLMVLLLGACVFAPAFAGHVRAQSAPPAGFPNLVGPLKATPGCIGVETARTSSGKQVIFAWFENKKAALNWYYSETHRAVMKQFAPPASSGQIARAPLADVPDDGTPILAIASVTLVDPSQVAPGAPPFSQIAIELYSPLSGGLALGGRFAPSAMKVPGMREVSLSSQKSDK